jgi:uncharacterized repeat protein (TIGR01451 family)
MKRSHDAVISSRKALLLSLSAVFAASIASSTVAKEPPPPPPHPHLVIKKGVAASNNSHAVFTPSLTPAGKWKPFGTSCPRFNGIITSAILPGLVNSNVSGLAAGNWVTFVIAIRNTGTAPAYDIELREIFPLDEVDRPACFSISTPFCVRRGNGAAIPFTTATAGHGRIGIKLASPIAGSNSTGTDVAIVTFNAQIISPVKMDCCENKTELVHYAAQPNGPDLVGSSTSLDYHDAARVCAKRYH